MSNKVHQSELFIGGSQLRDQYGKLGARNSGDLFSHPPPKRHSIGQYTL